MRKSDFFQRHSKTLQWIGVAVLIFVPWFIMDQAPSVGNRALLHGKSAFPVTRSGWVLNHKKLSTNKLIQQTYTFIIKESDTRFKTVKQTDIPALFFMGCREDGEMETPTLHFSGLLNEETPMTPEICRLKMRLDDSEEMYEQCAFTGTAVIMPRAGWLIDMAGQGRSLTITLETPSLDQPLETKFNVAEFDRAYDILLKECAKP